MSGAPVVPLVPTFSVRQGGCRACGHLRGRHLPEGRCRCGCPTYRGEVLGPLLCVVAMLAAFGLLLVVVAAAH